MDIGARIKELRINNNMTQKELAEELNVEPATVSKYESGMIDLTVKTVIKLAEIFNVNIEYFFEKNIKNVEDLDVLKILREQKDIKLEGNIYYYTQIAFSYNSNHIEGSTLTEEQTRYIYETNSFISENNSIIRLDDAIETTNHFKLVDYMLDVADKKLTEDMIKKFQYILKNGTSDEKKEWFNVGEYKAVGNQIGIGEMKTTNPKQVQKEMKKLLDWYESKKEITIEDIIEFHVKFEKIHPFQDGNGRVGRIIMFKECLRHSVIPFIILDKDKMFYYRGLKEYQIGREKGYLIDTCLNAQDQYIEKLKELLI